MVESIAFIFVDIGRRIRDSVPDLSAVLIIKESTVLKVPIRTDCSSLSEDDEKDADSYVAGSALFIWFQAKFSAFEPFMAENNPPIHYTLTIWTYPPLTSTYDKSSN